MKKDQKNLLIAGAAIIVTALLAFFLVNRNKSKAEPAGKSGDSIKVRADTLQLNDTTSVAVPVAASEYDEESPFSEYIVIGRQPIADGVLNQGDKVFVDEGRSNENSVVFYLQNPINNPNAVSISADAGNFIPEYQYNEYKKYFSLAPLSSLPAAVKKMLVSNDYSEGNSYVVTQNAERAKVTVCSGDFDGDGIMDYAVIMDNNEKQISRLRVFCRNPATKNYYEAYAENYSDKVRINSFRKNAKIFMNSESLVPSPEAGIIIQGENVKLALVYDRKAQKFKTYYQESTVDESEEY